MKISEIISATSQAGTPSSRIITRFSVPTSSTRAMPTETWNSDSRSSRGSGRVRKSVNGEPGNKNQSEIDDGRRERTIVETEPVQIAHLRRRHIIRWREQRDDGAGGRIAAHARPGRKIEQPHAQKPDQRRKDRQVVLQASQRLGDV